MNEKKYDESKITTKKEQLKALKKDLLDSYQLSEIDKELPMIINEKTVITKENLNLLRTVYLYINNYTYREISNLLGISMGSISEYINQTLNSELLSPVYLILLNNRKNDTNKFNREDVNKDIKKTVICFVENNGDYEKTTKICGISERTLSRYFANPKLQEIINDDELYTSFKNLIASISKQNMSSAISSSARVRKILKYMQNVNSTKEKKFAKILKLVLIDGITDINQISKTVQMNEDLVKRYLSSEAEIKEIFGDYIYEEYKLVKDKILINEDYEFQLSFITYYLQNRYTYRELEGIFALCKDKSNQLLNCNVSRFKDVLGDDIEERIQQHIKSIIQIRHSCPKDKMTVSDARMINMVKDDILYVSQTQFRQLSTLINYFDYRDNTKNQKTSINTLSAEVLTTLSSEELLSLLNDSTKAKLDNYLQYEMILAHSNSLLIKLNLMKKTIETLCETDFDIDLTLKQSNLPFFVLEYIINDPRLRIMYIQEVINHAKEKVEDYKLAQQSESIPTNSKKGNIRI